jgi:phosphoglycolate phosphatase/pyrophosphatase PpaX
LKIDAVIFDLDQTLTNTLPLVCYSMKQIFKKYIDADYSIDEIMELLNGPADENIVFDKIGPSKGIDAVEEYVKLYETFFDSYVKLDDTFLSIFEFLKVNGIKIGLFTGKSRRTTEITLSKSKIIKYFDSILTGTEILNYKPSSDGIVKSLELLNVNHENTLYIGDMEQDIAAGISAGVKTVSALWMDNSKIEIIRTNPDYCFMRVHDFYEWLLLNQFKEAYDNYTDILSVKGE